MLSNNIYFLVSENKFKIIVLYLFYFSYIFSLFFQNNQSALFEYMASIIGLSFFLIFFFKFNFKISPNLFILILICFFYLLFLPIYFSYAYVLLTYIKVIILLIFFRSKSLHIKYYLYFINYVYLFYFSLSLIVFFNLIPNKFYDPSIFQTPEFFVDLGFISYYVLPSIQGGPASFSTFSAIVFFLNLFFHKKNYYIIFIAFCGLLLTFRLTPLLSIFIGIILYPFFKYKSFSLFILLFIFSFFILILFGLMIDYSFLYKNSYYDLWSLGYVATHARTMIWEQQLFILFNNYTFFDYIFGNFSISLFEVPHFQLWGEIRQDGLHGNPHNTFLLLFFRNPLLFIIFFIYFFISVIKNHQQKRFFVIFIIFMSCFTDSSIISLGNPIFILTLTYLITYNYDSKSTSCSSRI